MHFQSLQSVNTYSPLHLSLKHHVHLLKHSFEHLWILLLYFFQSIFDSFLFIQGVCFRDIHLRVSQSKLILSILDVFLLVIVLVEEIIFGFVRA